MTSLEIFENSENKIFCHMLNIFKREIFRQHRHITTEAKEYDMITNMLERVRFGEHLLQKYEQFFRWEYGMTMHNNKSDEMAVLLRVEGNYLHNRGEYAEAIISYNKSLCFATSSENIAIGYSNRSASLFEMGRFKECKENIRLARELNALPENIKKKLDNRMLKCGNEEQGCLDNNTTSSELNLTYRNHASIPFIVDRLEIKEGYVYNEDEEYGIVSYWLYAKEYIEPGAVIMKEEVFNFLLFPDWYLKSCHFCLKMSAYLIPCPNCTSAMFCNKDCMMRANDQFHKWECPIMDLLNLFGDKLRFSFRIFLNMLHVFGDYEKLEKYWRELPEYSVSWFSIDRTKLTLTETYRIFHSSVQLHTTDFYCPVFIAIESVAVALFKTIIMKHSDLKRIFQTKEQSDLFGEIIYRHMLIFGKECKLSRKYEYEDENWGTLGYAVCYPLIKEIRPTDSPNVSQKWDGNHIIWSACEPIKKGECLRTEDNSVQLC